MDEKARKATSPLGPGFLTEFVLYLNEIGIQGIFQDFERFPVRNDFPGTTIEKNLFRFIPTACGRSRCEITVFPVNFKTYGFHNNQL